MVWAAIIPAVASLAGAAIGAMGQSSANKNNRGMANAQMAFQDEQNDQAWDRNRDAVTRSMEYEDWQRREQQAFQAASVNQQMDFQKETMATAMDYNTRMSNTSYQRGMADMRAAGLNPILAFGQGGATAPSVGAPSGSAATGGRGSGSTGGAASGAPGAQARMENALSGAVSGASQLGRLFLELQQLSANVQQTEAQTAQTNATTGLIGDQQHQVRANTALDTARAITEGVRPDLIRAQTRTEQGRPALVGAQAAQASTSAQSTAQEVQRFRDWGPRTFPADAAANIEAAGRRGVQTYRDNAPSMSVPSLPQSRPIDPGTLQGSVNRNNEVIQNLFNGVLERIRPYLR